MARQPKPISTKDIIEAGAMMKKCTIAHLLGPMTRGELQSHIATIGSEQVRALLTRLELLAQLYEVGE